MKDLKKIVGLSAVLLLLMPFDSVTALADSVDTGAETSAEKETLVVNIPEPKVTKTIEEKPEKTESEASAVPETPVESPEISVEETVETATEEVQETAETPVAEAEVSAGETAEAAPEEAVEIEEEPAVSEEISEDEVEVEDETVSEGSVEEEVKTSASETARTSATPKAAAAPFALDGNPYTGNWSDWTTKGEFDSVSSSFTHDGVNYTMVSKYNGRNHFFENEITNVSTGEVFTYSKPGTSSLQMGTKGSNVYTGVELDADSYYTKIEADGSVAIAKEGKIQNIGGYDLTFVEVMKVTTDGLIKHYVTITNNSSSDSYNDIQFITMMDVNLNGDEKTPIYADGNGNTYIKKDEKFTLYNQALDNVTQYIAPFTSANLKEEIKGGAGSVLMDGSKYSGLAYLTDYLNLAPGDSIEYAFQEGMFAEKIVCVITEEYVDADGNTISVSKVTNGNLGGVFNPSPLNLPNYHLYETKNATNKFTREPQTITYVYLEVEEPGTPIDPGMPGSPGNPLDPGKPAEPAPNQPGNGGGTGSGGQANPTPTVAKKSAPAKATPVAAKAQTAGKDALPATGEAQNSLAFVAGAFMVALSGFGFFKKNKKDKE